MEAFVKYLAVSALVLTCAVNRARADFIVNGGFETGNFSGWTVSGEPGANIMARAAAGYEVQSGNYFALLGSRGSPGYLSQTFTDPNPGETLTISLYLASNGTTPSEFQVVFNGVTLFDETKIPATGTRFPFPYVQLTFDVTSQSSNTLQLGFRNDPSFLALDDVSVNAVANSDPPDPPSGSAVPEPSSLLLLGEGAAALLGLAWRCRRPLRTVTM